MKKSFTNFLSGLECQLGSTSLLETDKWFPIHNVEELNVDDFVRVPDGLVRVVSVPDGKGIFYGEVVTPIHDEVEKGEVYEYTVKETQVLGKKKNKNKVSFRDLTQIDDVSIRHKNNEIEINPVIEKYMNSDEIHELINKVISSVKKIIKDKDRDKKERETGREVLDWVKNVRKTYTETGSIHPNTVRSLMKTVSGTSSSNEKGWGYRTKGWKKSPDGKVPDDFRNEDLEEGLTQTIIRGLSLRLKSKIISIGRKVRSQPEVEGKLDLLSKQLSGLSGLVLLSVSVSGGGLLSKSSILSSLFTEDKKNEKLDG